MNPNKDALRDKYKKIRKDILHREEKDAALCSMLINTRLYREARNIMFYVSMPHEPDTKALMRRAFADGKGVFVPKVVGKTEMMICAAAKDARFVKGAFGIFEPEGDPFADGKDMDLIIVPGLAFDKKGVRLGFGGGFYDRFLARITCDTVGLCYDECLAERLIKDIYDVSVKYIVTEKELICCGG